MTRECRVDRSGFVWIRLAIALSVVLAVSAGIAGIAARGRRRRAYAEAVRLWRAHPAEARLAALDPVLRAGAGGEHNAVAWYLAGCLHTRAGRWSEAARAFGVSYHADCRFESAALMTFACLKAAASESPSLVEQMVATWHEMGRPSLPAAEVERTAFEGLAPSGGRLPNLSPLGRLAWLASSEAGRAEIETAIERGGTGWAAALRGGPA